MNRPFLLLLLLTLLSLCGCTGQIVDPVKEKLYGGDDPGLMEGEVIPLGLSLRTFKGGEAIRGNKTYDIVWHIKTDPNFKEWDPGFYESKVELSTDDGITWQVPPGAAAIPGVSDQDIVYAWAVPYGAPWEGEAFKVKITVKNTAGNEHSVTSSSFVIDNGAPVITPGTLTLNGRTDSPFATKAANVSINFQATDSLSPISAVCFKMNSLTAPAEDDPCWKPFPILGLTPAKSVDISNLSQFLGFVGGSFTLYFWVADKAGNASVLTNNTGDLGVDSRVIVYSPGNVVSYQKMVAANSDAAGKLPTLDELKINPSNRVLYIKWAMTLEAGGVLHPTEPMVMEYTTDDLTYTRIDGILTDGVNGACTLTGDATGCYAWSVPDELLNKYFRVRLVTKDDGNFIYTVASNALNTGRFRTLAGNTDPGIGGSASQAVFNTRGSSTSERADVGTIAIANNGRTYVKDFARGVLYINPDDGSLRVLIPITSASVDGPVGTATTSNLIKIAMDYSGGLLLMEKTKIRRMTCVTVDGDETCSVETIVGGGSVTNVSTSGIEARSFKMNVGTDWQWAMFTPLPNGDIYFTQNGANQLMANVDFRVYKKDKNKVYPLRVSGKGAHNLTSGQYEPYRDLSDLVNYSQPGLSFNPMTSWVDALVIRWCKSLPGTCVFYASNVNPRSGISAGTGTHYPVNHSWMNHSYLTSRRGELYEVTPYTAAGLYKINTATRQWVRQIGTGTTGQCADGTQALACAVDITDAFVTADNVPFFVDRNVIRAVGTDGAVVTVFGQSKSKGDGGDPLIARFNQIDFLDVWGPNDTIVIMDSNELIMREIIPGAIINTIAGNRGRAPYHGWNADKTSQRVATDSALQASYWGHDTGFVVDPDDGAPVVYTHSGNQYSISKLDRGTGKWRALVGAGTKSLTDPNSANNCDNVTNNCKIADAHPPHTLGLLPAVEIDGVTAPAQALISIFRRHSGDWQDRCYVKTATLNDATVGHFMGNPNDCLVPPYSTSPNFAPAGVDMSTSNSFPIFAGDQIRSFYYAPTDSLLWAKHLTKRVVKIPIIRDAATKRAIKAGKIEDFVNTPTDIKSFVVLNDSNGREKLVYCDRSGLLQNMDLTNGETSSLGLPTGVTCVGKAMKVSADGRKVIFSYLHNGIYAVGEYLVAE